MQNKKKQLKIKNIYIIFIVLGVLVFGQSCKKEVDTDSNNGISKELENSFEIHKLKNKKATVKLQPINNSEIFGSVVLKEKDNEVIMMVLVNNLEEGNYKMYIVNNNNCSGLIENKNSHWNPTNQNHGSWGDKLGYHKGDIGFLKIDGVIGSGTLRFSTNEWCLGCDDDTKNVLGKGLIVVKDYDDTVSDSKNNIILSCGLIEEVK